MYARPSLAALLALAGAADAQTPTLMYEISVKGLPSQQPMLMLGDYAQVEVHTRINPPVGSVITLPNNSTGTIAGLASVWFDIRTCDPGSHPAEWTVSGPGFLGTTGSNWGLRSGWNLGSPGTPLPDSSIEDIQGMNFVVPGQTANALNPITEIWRGKWTPQMVTPATTTRFTVYPTESWVYIRTGINPKNGHPIYTAVAASAKPATVQVLHDPGTPDPCFPGFWTAPQDQHVLPGEAAVFSVQLAPPGTGCPPRQLQWRRNCTLLTDGGSISGTTTATLRIDPVTAADADFYVFSANNWQGSQAARLTVGCYANCDLSTASPLLSANDFACFINRLNAGDNYSNCDGSSSAPLHTANDFLCFVNRYAAGCH